MCPTAVVWYPLLQPPSPLSLLLPPPPPPVWSAADESHGVNGIRQQLEKKEGLFRKNMMGKRVNFACRSGAWWLGAAWAGSRSGWCRVGRVHAGAGVGLNVGVCRGKHPWPASIPCRPPPGEGSPRLLRRSLLRYPTHLPAPPCPHVPCPPALQSSAPMCSSTAARSGCPPTLPPASPTQSGCARSPWQSSGAALRQLVLPLAASSPPLTSATAHTHKLTWRIAPPPPPPPPHPTPAIGRSPPGTWRS